LRSLLKLLTEKNNKLKLIFLKRTLGLCITIILLSFLNSCKEPDSIGTEIQPIGDQLNVETYNVPLTAYSVKEDSIRSDESVYNLLGLNDDPVFGKNAASFYTQLRLPSSNPDFTGCTLDSIFLSLDYKKIYGDTNSQMTVKVYELASDIYVDSVYYSNRELLTTGTVIGSKTFVPKLKDSVYLGTDTVPVAPHLRIKLNNDWGIHKFLDASGSTSLSDNANFIKYFKGIYVTTTSASGRGSIVGFDLLNSLSKITLYYKKDTTKHAYNLVINENCARIGHFNHSKYHYADLYLRSEIYGDTAKGDSILYLHSMAGLKVRVLFPNLKDTLLKYGKVAINKANFIVDLDNNDYTESDYAPPPQLVLLEELDGKIRFLIDQYDGMTYYGGAYNASKKEYKFNIARHIQQILDGAKDNLGLYLVVWTADRPNSANRVVLKGPKRKTGNLRLQITYTKLY
jgi:hypothetical protein